MPSKHTDAERQRFYTELDRSGDTAWRVARRIGLNSSTAYRWQRERLRVGPQFARVVRGADVASGQPSGIEIKVGSVAIVVERGFDPELLRAVVHAVAGERIS